MATTNRAKSDWITLLQQANISKADPIPKGYKSTDDWTREYDISERCWQRTVPRLEKQGLFVRGYFRVLIADGRTLKKPFWKKC